MLKQKQTRVVTKHTKKAKQVKKVKKTTKRQFSAKSQSISAYPDTPVELDRVKGDFPTFFRHAVLTKVMTDMVSKGGPITYFNICGGNVAHQLKESHLHKDAVFLYKWLRLPIGLRSIPDGIASLQPWLKQFAYANEDVPMDAFGFPKDLYLPGVDFIANRVLRPQDKHIVFETEEHQIDLLNMAFGNDPRFSINTTGLRKETDLKALFPTYGRALVHVDIHESTTFAEQKRARNALFGFMKRMPHATYVITYPLVEDYHPYEFLDAFARTGMQTGYGTAQFADNLATERIMATSIAENYNGADTDAMARWSQTGQARPILGMWAIKPEEFHQFFMPSNIEVFKPRTYWSGAGALVFNASMDATNYDQTLQDIGDSLRTVLGKPTGMRYGKSGPLYEPQSYEMGVAWGHKQSFTTPGFSPPEDWNTMTLSEINEDLDLRFIDRLIHRLDYLPMKGGPTNFVELAGEAKTLTAQAKRMIEDPDIKKRSKKQERKQTPLGVYNRLVSYARQQDLPTFREAMREKYEIDHGYAYNPYKSRRTKNTLEEGQGFQHATQKFAPLYHEEEGKKMLPPDQY
eukprot:UN02539